MCLIRRQNETLRVIHIAEKGLVHVNPVVVKSGPIHVILVKDPGLAHEHHISATPIFSNNNFSLTFQTGEIKTYFFYSEKIKKREGRCRL